MGRQPSNIQVIKVQLSLLSSDYQILSILAGPHSTVPKYISELIADNLSLARGRVSEALGKLSDELRREKGEPVTPKLPFPEPPKTPPETPLTNVKKPGK